VIPAAAVMLFAAVDAAQSAGRKVNVAVTYVQIYKAGRLYQLNAVDP
jgi:hypothetical protein